jgi:hypothetical protein
MLLKRTHGALLRLFLGTAQMAGAATALLLIVQTGLSEWARGAVVITCLFTTASVLLFGRRLPPRC